MGGGERGSACDTCSYVHLHSLCYAGTISITIGITTYTVCFFTVPKSDTEKHSESDTEKQFD